MAPVILSRTRQAIAAISSGPCADLLRPKGFKRAAPNFWRHADDIYQSVSFQASQWGSADQGSFTVNIGVSSPALYTAFTGRAFPKNPSTTLWPINQRIGALIPNPHDLWWNIDAATDLDAIGRAVADTLARYGLPFLDGLQTPPQFESAVLEGSGIPGLTEAQAIVVRATLAAQQGKKDLAKSLLENAIEKYGGKPFETTVSRIAQELAPYLRDD